MTELIDTTEMYLRTVYELEEEGIRPLRARIVERLGHSGPTVSQTVARMERAGLLTVRADRSIDLSDEGRARATRVMRKHRLAERLLSDVLGLEFEYVHDEACRWEHVMSDRVERKIVALLGDHELSPYGNPIPGLDELGESSAPEEFLSGLTTLSAVATGEAVAVVVRRIGEPAQNDAEVLALLTESGLVPGEHATVRRNGSMVEVVRGKTSTPDRVSLPDDVAAHVFIGVLEL
ncbi:MAG: metal-dependent transcriptional regulator [Nostocoides sp.]